MPNFTLHGSLEDFQSVIRDIYGLPDDRLFSVSDLLSNAERFTMRALKGIRKGERKKLSKNLLIAFSWLMAIANRLSINAEKEVWHRFSGRCSYCGKSPCVCREQKIKMRIPPNTTAVSGKPQTLSGFQDMFEKIYPSDKRTLADAGVHLAEEIGELSEAVHNFLGEHKQKQFAQIELELADCISCLCGVANSARLDIAEELAVMYGNGCHVCHKSPCACNFSYVATFES